MTDAAASFTSWFDELNNRIRSYPVEDPLRLQQAGLIMQFGCKAAFAFTFACGAQYPLVM